MRVYTPEGQGPFPVLVYYHGGGWVLFDLDVYDASCRGLANAGGCVVLSVDYRQAPEHRYPAAHEDTFAAYAWARSHAPEIGGDPGRVGVPRRRRYGRMPWKQHPALWQGATGGASNVQVTNRDQSTVSRHAFGESARDVGRAPPHASGPGDRRTPEPGGHLEGARHRDRPAHLESTWHAGLLPRRGLCTVHTAAQPVQHSPCPRHKDRPAPCDLNAGLVPR